MTLQQYEAMKTYLKKVKRNKIPKPPPKVYPITFTAFKLRFLKANVNNDYRVKVGTGYTRFHIENKYIQDILNYCDWAIN